MNKIIIGIIVVLFVGAGWFLYSSSTISNVAVVDNEVSQLEAELAALEQAVTNGDISPEEALIAKAKIVARMDTINQAVSAADNSSLTASQRSQLLSGLGRLKVALGTYAATLTSIDTVADQADAATKAKHRGGSKKVAAVISDTIAVVDEQAQEVIEDYVPELVEIPMGNAEGATETETEVDTAGTSDSGEETEVVDEIHRDTNSEVEAEAEIEAVDSLTATSTATTS